MIELVSDGGLSISDFIISWSCSSVVFQRPSEVDEIFLRLFQKCQIFILTEMWLILWITVALVVITRVEALEKDKGEAFEDLSLPIDFF